MADHRQSTPITAATGLLSAREHRIKAKTIQFCHHSDTILPMAMTLRLTDEQDRALSLLAAAQGRSKHDAAVKAIIAQAARTLSQAEVAALAERFLDDYAATKKALRHNHRG